MFTLQIGLRGKSRIGDAYGIGKYEVNVVVNGMGNAFFQNKISSQEERYQEKIETVSQREEIGGKVLRVKVNVLYHKIRRLWKI